MARHGPSAIAPYLSASDQMVVREFAEPDGPRARAAWKHLKRYQRELLRSQLDTRTDNGSRRSDFLERYCEPIADFLASHSPTILQPGCGCGQWIPFLRHRTQGRFIGFDISKSLVRYAGRKCLDSFAEVCRADVLDLPSFPPADMVLLDYEFLNAFDFKEAASILRWAYQSVRPGGLIFGDLRLKNCWYKPSSSMVIKAAHRSGSLLWAERGCIGSRHFGVQSMMLALAPLRIVSLRQDIIRLFTFDEFTSLLSLLPWGKVELSKIDHIPTDKPESASNARFLLVR